jgi:cell division protease FtsH
VSEKVASEIDSAVRGLIESAYDKSSEIIKEHLDQVHQLAAYLLEHEKIDADMFKKLMNGELPPSTPTPDATTPPPAAPTGSEEPESPASGFWQRPAGPLPT